MNCPKCQSKMEKVTFADVEVDRCTHCKGIWFNMLERERLKSVKGSEAIDVGNPENGAGYDTVDRIDCPVCRTRMIRMVDKDQPHIRYESCGVCHGAFFDAGEFTDYKDRTLKDFFKDFLARERR